MGPWTIWIRIQKEGRFPKIDDLIRPAGTGRSQLSIDPRDARFALESLQRLPTGEDANRSVTLDLNGEVLIRAQADPSTPPSELFLARSKLIGEPVRLVASGAQFGRALSMGFTEFQLFGPDVAIQACDARRHYITMPFSADGAVEANALTQRTNSLDSRLSVRFTRPIPEPILATRAAAISDAPLAAAIETRTEGPVSPVDQLHALRARLRDALRITSDLVRALPRPKRRSQIAESTLRKRLPRVA